VYVLFVVDRRYSGHLCLEHRDPSSGLLREATSAAIHKTFLGSFPKIQIVTAEDILDGKQVESPSLLQAAKKAAAAVSRESQMSLPGVAME
jgi:hypothetical protein